MTKLWDYFGFVGCTSLVLWIAVVVAIVMYRKHARRTVVYAGCVVVAILASLLANWNATNVGFIMVDRGDQKAALAEDAEAQLRAEAVEALKRNAASINFAEDDATDALDIAGAKEVDPSVIAAGEAEYAYRQRGKQERAAGKKRNDEVIEEAAEVVTEEPTMRYMSEIDVIRATAFSRLNRSLAKWVLLAALIAFVIDYFVRFNRTWGGYFPLPIGGRWVDGAFPKTHSTFVESPTPQQVDALLNNIVRKGETYIDLSPPPLGSAPGSAEGTDIGDAEHDQVSRLTFRSKPLVALPRHHLTSLADDPQMDWVFESAWFGRACFVISDEPAARRFIAHVLERLRMRRIPQASARRTVNLVWRFSPPIDDPVLNELLRQCPEVNFKLIVCAPAVDTAVSLDGFEERLTLESA